MPLHRNKFLNPATGDEYTWPTNHATEDAVQKSRQMGDGAQTSNIGLVPQQGAATPLVLQWEGTMFLDAEVEAVMDWWNTCETQTIKLQDFSGSQAEVIITDFNPQRVPCVRNPRLADGTPNSYYTWSYTITFRVLKAPNGIWHSFDPQATS